MFEDIKTIAYEKKVNLMLLPCTQVDLKRYNEYVKFFNDLRDNELIKNGFIWTNSNGISKKNCNMIQNTCCYEIRNSTWMAEIIFIDRRFGMGRIQYQFANREVKKEKMLGHKAYIMLKKQLKKDGIELNDYKIKDGEKVKQTIPSPYIKVQHPALLDKTLDCCHHLDINSAYPYAMTLMHPEWKTTIQRLYDRRKKNPTYKLVLNASYGYFQSKYINYSLAHISKFCIENTIEMLDAVSELLVDLGFKIIAYNTDGVWFQGINPNLQLLKDEFENNHTLGDFKLDHTMCRLRFKSRGCYEYIENGKYYPVVRGKTNLDYIRPRDKWQWGDIYKALICKYHINEDGTIEEVFVNE